MSERKGPRVWIGASCNGCQYERTVTYRVQGDSGRDVYCDAPGSGDEGGNRHVGDTTWVTPDWCPFLKSACAALIPMLEDK